MTLTPDERSEALVTIRRGLDEDLRYGPDVTTAATVPADARTEAALVARESGVVAGVDVALMVLDEVLGADGYRVLDLVPDGTHVEQGQSLLRVEGPTRGLLTAERTLLNLVCHLSGIATATAAWGSAVEGTKTKIRDTRKTLPGLRAVQTPKGFLRAVLQAAHANADDDTATDDASLVERQGVTVHVIAGHEEAFKVTRPLDLVLAEAVLAKRRASRAIG